MIPLPNHGCREIQFEETHSTATCLREEPRQGASQKDAFIAAGYKAKHPDQGAHQALKQIRGKVPQIMDQMGLTDHFLIEKYLVPLLEAEETKFFKEGSKRINVAALGIRHTALDAAFKLRGSYAPRDPAEASQYGVKLVVLDMPRPPGHPQNAVIDISGKGRMPMKDQR